MFPDTIVIDRGKVYMSTHRMSMRGRLGISIHRQRLECVETYSGTSGSRTLAITDQQTLTPGTGLNGAANTRALDVSDFHNDLSDLALVS